MTDKKTSSPRRALLQTGLGMLAAGSVLASNRARAQEKLAQALV